MRSVNHGGILLLSVVLLSACGDEKYSVEQSTKQGDVINIHGKITNLDRFNQFVKDVDQKIESKLTVVQMTIEGDPIYYYFSNKDGSISYKFDNSEDKFGSKNMMKTVCTGFVSEKVERGFAYKLSGCKDTEVGQSFSFVVPSVEGQ